MKRRSILAVVAIAMLCATPVFAAEIEWKPLDFYETGKAIGNDIKKAINGSGATIESETT